MAALTAVVLLGMTGCGGPTIQKSYRGEMGQLAEMDRQVRYPGMRNIFWMPIQTRNEMLATGVRSKVGVKVFGADLDTVERYAVEVERALQDMKGTRSAFAERATGGYFLDFDIRRAEAARYGLTVGDVEDVIESAVVMVTRPLLQPSDLRLGDVRKPSAGGETFTVPEGLTLADLEKEALGQLLRRHEGNRTLVADKLGISRRTIQRKIKEFDLPF